MNNFAEVLAIVLSGSKKPLPVAPAICLKTARKLFQDWVRLAIHYEEIGNLDKAKNALEQAQAALDCIEELKLRSMQ